MEYMRFCCILLIIINLTNIILGLIFPVYSFIQLVSNVLVIFISSRIMLDLDIIKDKHGTNT